MAAEVLEAEVHPLDPVAQCLNGSATALAALPDGPLPMGEAHVLEALVEENARQQRVHAELGLRLAKAAEASRVALVGADTDTGAWLARLTGSNAAMMRGGLWLARMLQDRYPVVRQAFALGELGESHARIIVRAAEQMPAEVTDDERDEAVDALVRAAVERRLNDKALRRRARRMLDRVNRAHADRHEADLVAEEEKKADVATFLTMGDTGDGTWSGRFVIPDLQAGILRTVLEHLSSPRRVGRGASGAQVVDDTIADRTDAWAGLSYSDRMGQAFLELIEHYPTDGFAQHGRVGATIAVHIDHQHLVDTLAAAHLDTGDDISVGEARRLACNAGVMPIVYGGASAVLDAGREARLHNRAQRMVKSGEYGTCAAQGCERPFAWCEMHHPIAWAEGGRTDLTALPLCGWHHRRAHDGSYDMRTLPTGEIRFHRRR